jgi:ATP-binding cassette subfamily C protein
MKSGACCPAQQRILCFQQSSQFNLALLFKYNVKLALFACLFVLISILVTFVFGRIEMNHERESMKISNKISGLVLEILSGIAKFKIAGAESRAFYQWAQTFKVQRKISSKKRLAQNGLSTFNAIFTTITSGFIFYFIIRTKNAGLTAGDFIAFNGAFAKFFSSMVSLSQTFMSVNTIVPMFELSKPILETLPEFDEEKKDPGILTGNIEINHVTFRYKEDAPIVLDDVSIKINEGEYVALVGPSGCGKSTLFRTLLGFEKPQSGKIYYDVQDLDSIDVRAVRKQLGVVLQIGQLMSGDIFTNIVASNPNLTMKDAVEAAKMAGFHADIEQMPMGMHTMISEGAGTLSGGQRQRLLIARAIVNKPRIIYFDEATSALDNTTQAIVSKSLDNLKATRIVIAHRLSTIVNCDRIIVMDKGRVVEDGTYDELMKRNGVFSQLAARQLA